jgi:hypothetical protein
MSANQMGPGISGSTGILPVGPVGFQPAALVLISTSKMLVGPTGETPVLRKVAR